MRRALPAFTATALTAVLAAGDPASAILAQRNPRPAMDLLRHLTESIGPRLTGSAQDHGAHAWAQGRFEALGLTVHREEVPMARTWTRGKAQARFQGHGLRVAQWGWTPGTAGKVQGHLLLVRNASDLERLKDQLKGAIVLAGPAVLELDPLLMNPPLRLPRPPRHEDGFPMEALAARLKALGALALLKDAGKSHERLNMSSPESLYDCPLPVAFVSHRRYQALVVGAVRGAKLELELGGALGPAGHTLNTIAELKGSKTPAEVVILGAHLDSWDLATGAADNGAGVVAVMEAARILSGLDQKPKRTIRFILFGGEEEGYLGSTAYVRQHKEELARISAVFVMDTGAGAIDGFALQHRPQAARILMPLLAPLARLGVTDTDLRNEGETDFVPFDTAGVPAFCAEQKQHSYAVDHHAESDTLDKVRPAELQQAAVVMAYTAWQVAQLPMMLPRER